MVDLSIILPEGFLNEEMRCGYTITQKYKELWAVQLDLLAQVDRICKKYGIRYFAAGGTLLGAVRHKGMIPWDDDIDLGMMRKDYERFCQVAVSELKQPYFFQTQYTDPGSLRGHAQIRNSNTTAKLSGDRHQNITFNEGIFIDIFPLDFTNRDPKQFQEQGRKAELYKRLYLHLARNSFLRHKNGSYKGTVGKIIDILYPISNLVITKLNLVNYFYKKFEETCAVCKEEQADCAGYHSFKFFENRFIFALANFEEVIEVPFEFTTIPIPAGYDSMLRNQYGDYQKFVIGTSFHGCMQFDADIPYDQYVWREAEHEHEI